MKTVNLLVGAMLSALATTAAQASPIVIPPDATWHWQLNGTLQTPDRQVYDIDLFDTPATTITNLKGQGRIVICYFSAGSREDWRPDASQYPASAIGAPLGGWAGEHWVDTRNQEVRNILAKRMDLAVIKGCDGVEPDNVDGYSNANGLSLTKSDQLDFNRWLAYEAHARGLSVALKNAVELVPDLVHDFDFALNESCYRYNECSVYSVFRGQGKAVLIADYRSYNATLCNKAKASGFNLQFFKTALKTVGKACN